MRSQQLGEAVRLDKTRHDTATKIWLNATTHPPQRVAVWKYGAVCMVGWLVSNDKATAVSFWFSTDSKYVLALELSKQREQRAGVNFDGKLSEGPLAVIPSLAALNKSWSCS